MFCVGLIMVLCAPMMAHAKKGKIHLAPSAYGYSGPVFGSPNFQTHIITINRANAPINYRIDFYNLNGDLVASTDSAVLNANATSFIVTQYLPQLSSYNNNTALTPVVVWEGDVRIPPTVMAQALFTNESGQMTNLVPIMFYDDNTGL